MITPFPNSKNTKAFTGCHPVKAFYVRILWAGGRRVQAPSAPGFYRSCAAHRTMGSAHRAGWFRGEFYIPLPGAAKTVQPPWRPMGLRVLKFDGAIAPRVLKFDAPPARGLWIALRCTANTFCTMRTGFVREHQRPENPVSQ